VVGDPATVGGNRRAARRTVALSSGRTRDQLEATATGGEFVPHAVAVGVTIEEVDVSLGVGVRDAAVFEGDTRVTPHERHDATVGARRRAFARANTELLPEPKTAAEERSLARDHVLGDDVALEIDVAGGEFVAIRFDERPASVRGDPAQDRDPGRNTAGGRLRNAVRPLSVRRDGRQKGKRDDAQKILVV